MNWLLVGYGLLIAAVIFAAAKFFIWINKLLRMENTDLVAKTIQNIIDECNRRDPEGKGVEFIYIIIGKAPGLHHVWVRVVASNRKIRAVVECAENISITEMRYAHRISAMFRQLGASSTETFRALQPDREEEVANPQTSKKLSAS